MKRTLLLPLAALAITAGAQSKLDLAGQKTLSQYRTMMTEGKQATLPMVYNSLEEVILQSNGRSSAAAGMLIRLNEGYTAEDITDAIPAISVQAVLGPIVVAEVPLETVDALDALDAVKSISIGNAASPLMKAARKAGNVDAIHAGTELDQPFKGTGVVVGLYDTGMDPNHINFFKADGSENRVRRIWRFANSGTYDEYNTPERIAKFTTEASSQTHGTHVLGILAGAYNGKDGEWAERKGAGVFSRKSANPFYGVAPDADIAISCGVLLPSNYTLGAKHISDYAASEGKPAVVNLSIGSMVGPHDGTDNDVVALDEVGKSAIVCVAAGNEAEYPLYLDKKFTSADNVLKTFVTVAGAMHSATGVLDIWADNGEAFVFTPLIYDLSEENVVYSFPVDKPAPTTYVTTSNYTAGEYQHNAVFDRAFSNGFWIFNTEVNPNNNRYHAEIQFDLTGKNRNLVFGVMIEGPAGQTVQIFHNDSNEASMTSLEREGWSNGTNTNTINNLACGTNMIAVGSFNSADQWGTLGKKPYAFKEEYGYGVGLISPFSSYGTTFQGLQLPHVCAPGSIITSSYSTYNRAAISDRDELVAEAELNGRKNYWSTMQGTSMASPFMAGVVALWLEADPSLSVDKVKEIINKTSVNDENTASTPERWGAGKVDAYAGLKMVLGQTGVNPTLTDDKRVLVTRTANGIEIVAGGEKGVEAVVYDLRGAAVAAGQSSDATLTLSTAGISKGIYVVNVKADGTNVSRKVVID